MKGFLFWKEHSDQSKLAPPPPGPRDRPGSPACPTQGNPGAMTTLQSAHPQRGPQPGAQSATPASPRRPLVRAAQGRGHRPRARPRSLPGARDSQSSCAVPHPQPPSSGQQSGPRLRPGRHGLLPVPADPLPGLGHEPIPAMDRGCRAMGGLQQHKGETAGSRPRPVPRTPTVPSALSTAPPAPGPDPTDCPSG